MESDRLIHMAEAEIATHQAEAQRLHDMADMLVTQAEHHLRQTTKWQDYISGLVCERVATVTPITRYLSLVPDQAS